MGQQAVFQCIHLSADTIGWKVNNTALNTLNKSNISSGDINVLSGGSIQNALMIDALKEYNNTSITCVALTIGYFPEDSPQAMLLIQG